MDTTNTTCIENNITPINTSNISNTITPTIKSIADIKNAYYINLEKRTINLYQT